MSVGVLFPGQGSQFVGMGGDLFDHRPDLLGDRADEILGFSLRNLCLDGPAEELTRTEHAQPALFAVSFALWGEVESKAGFVPAGAAGHSLGEYTALAAAGVFDYETALGLVGLRGRAMARAAGAEPSGMAALLGADPDGVEEMTRARNQGGGRLAIANLNAPGQVVVAGGIDDISWLAGNAGVFGVRRVVTLDVAGAFHSSFMEPARAELSSALAPVETRTGRFPVWSNTTARPHEDDGLKEVLVRQLVEPVRFSESLLDMSRRGMTSFIHVGPGDVTAGLARKSVPGAMVRAISGLEDIPSIAGPVVTIDQS